MTRVLLLEDDADAAAEIIFDLRKEGFVLQHAVDGRQGVELAQQSGWDLFIFDCMLPGIDGLEILRSLRTRGIETPALMLTALGATHDRICGLRAGADDYLVKPFALGELLARLEALLRRRVGAPVLRVGPVVLDLLTRTACRGDRRLELLPREFQVLEFMMRHAGAVVTRTMLLENVFNYRFTLDSNLVDVHMGRLRRKLDQPGEEGLISNVRGTGFILSPPI